MLFIKGEFLSKVRTKLQIKEITERRKPRFLKETVENADLYKAVLNKTMTRQEQCVKYDFVASLSW